MPSTTPNYGWSYPISSDDLNAGATTTGNLATGADASLKAEETARVAAVSSEASTRAAADTALDNAKPNSNVNNVDYTVVTTTTNSAGQFAPGGSVAEMLPSVGRLNPFVTPVWIIHDNSNPGYFNAWTTSSVAGGTVTPALSCSITYVVGKFYS